MADYNSTHTGSQFDEAVAAALNPDSAPTASSAALISSGGVAAAIAAETSRAMAAEAALAPKASPAFTGSPTAPTPAQSNDSNRIATTAFVVAMVAGVGGLAQAEAIPGSADLDSYQTPGTFYCTTTPSQSVGHNPSPGLAFVLLVIPRDTRGQLQLMVSGSTGINIFARTSYDGAWGAWTRFSGAPV